MFLEVGDCRFNQASHHLSLADSVLFFYFFQYSNKFGGNSNV
ncbi:hypothetical protein OpiT1DRAFT_04758 [Opitutaceae bacterium TAV1]|nr:hypothetical protein OpiT1DRAFT_04758 [Opitutaceae bacterium TAV1]